MSEYQYYEFQAIDRPLSERELSALRALSTRARITSTSFVNSYSWGGFKGDPDDLMEKCFDAFVYLANWGTREFMLRLPRRLMDVKTAALYCKGDTASARIKGQHGILAFSANDESERDWVEGSGWLSSMISVRSDLLRGDNRSLYFGWLLRAQAGELEGSVVEPPVPPGLGELSGSLKSLAEFLWLDPSLIEVAAEQSAPLRKKGPAKKDLAARLRALPESEKDSFLLRLAQDDDRHIGAEVLRRLGREQSASNSSGHRTVKQLLEAARKRAAEKRLQAAELEARKRAERLNELAKREDALWRQVDELVASKKSKGYNEAVELLKDLKEVGVHTGKSMQFEQRFEELRRQNHGKFGLNWRLTEAGLTK